MEKFGFYGGCFNPPTVAHISLAQKIIKKYKLNKLFFVPVGNMYLKSDLADEKHRMNMLKIATRDLAKIEVLDIEINKNKNFKAYEIFNIVQENYNNSENYFIMGADNFTNIESWDNSEQLMENYKYIILQRKGFDVERIINSSEILTKNKENYFIMKNDFIGISSTQVRELINQKQYDKLNEYLNKNIIEYVKINELYCKQYVENQ